MAISDDESAYRVVGTYRFLVMGAGCLWRCSRWRRFRIHRDVWAKFFRGWAAYELREVFNMINVWWLLSIDRGGLKSFGAWTEPSL